ncbi:MAG: hypothetical protein AAGC79_04350 [Pseudomonadota bacterium]
MSDTARHLEFHLEEYKSLRTEMMSLQTERRLTDRLGASAIVAIYAWLLTTGGSIPDLLARLNFLLPTLIAYLCYLQSTRISKGIRTVGSYLAHFEKKYADPEIGGWEYMLSHIRENSTLPQPASETRDWLEQRVELDRLSSLSAGFWRWSILGTVGIALVVNALLVATNPTGASP